MKASNPKVMIQAYRLLVDRMTRENMHYPLHLGVTEAGDGEDGRIKSAIGIGSLLLDGLGDTIRVSLTEDSVYEIPVARAVADKAMSRWETPREGARGEGSSRLGRDDVSDGIDPYRFVRREIRPLSLSASATVGLEHPPRVITRVGTVANLREVLAGLSSLAAKDTPAEGLLVDIAAPDELDRLPSRPDAFYVLHLAPHLSPADIQSAGALANSCVLLREVDAAHAAGMAEWMALARERGFALALATDPAAIDVMGSALRDNPAARLIFTVSDALPGAGHAVGAYRRLAEALTRNSVRAPIWIRNTAATAVQGGNSFLSRLIEASFLSGALLCDGIGDCLSIETEPDPLRATRLAYNVLQGAGARISKTEFVACPSCGRTLFDLQTTTQRIRAQTGHLKGVKIAIMGCIVNGPGEMADADFGYVGGAPGKINLYVGKTCVQYNLPEADADARLIALIKEHGKWTEPAGAPA
jgi:(E)-4-hydroxy-3-methylbut-2-enyl-diphosphate synthase